MESASAFSTLIVMFWMCVKPRPDNKRLLQVKQELCTVLFLKFAFTETIDDL
jgi:hypothetical protein